MKTEKDYIFLKLFLIIMSVYGFYLDYENSYQRFSFKISHKAFSSLEGKWVEVEGDNIELDEDSILFFEKIFSSTLKIAYVDILNAETGELNVWQYDLDHDLKIIHKVLWRHLKDKISYIIYSISSGEDNIQNLNNEKEIESFFRESGIPIF